MYLHLLLISAHSWCILLTLVSQDLPEDIFDHDEDEETDEDGGGSDLHAADAIDAVMDSNNGDINLASVIDDLDASFVDALAERYITCIQTKKPISNN